MLILLYLNCRDLSSLTTIRSHIAILSSPLIWFTNGLHVVFVYYHSLQTIDNDVDLIDRSFGFTTSVEAAQTAILSAKTEARCNMPNGIGESWYYSIEEKRKVVCPWYTYRLLLSFIFFLICLSPSLTASLFIDLCLTHSHTHKHMHTHSSALPH